MSDSEEFESLIRSIKRPNCDIEGFLQFLAATDFYIAPASTKYHLAEPGGLLKHELKVYHKLVDLVDMQYKHLPFPMYDEDSLKITAFGHDLAKIDFYELTANSRKDYNPNGKNHDALGSFDWISELGYKVKDAKSRLVFGTHGENSYRLASQFFAMNDEEAAAIIWHMGGMDNIRCDDLSAVFSKYPLVTLLHTADYLSTYLDESR